MGILLCGLNGCGKSTMGRMLAERLSYQFIDNEDLYFPKTDIDYLFSSPRNKEEAVRLLEEKIEQNPRFVFAAVRGDYGKKLLASLEHVILIDVPKDVRLRRVRERSFQKFGKRMLPGGDLYEKESAFFSMVESRPDDYVTGWLQKIDCPVIHVDGTQPVEKNVEYLLSIL
ncbi:MAG: AAA family ATPase [Clostridia bacterium]|nr:AAA family ATPase [Clostridia bacterium]